MSRRIAALGMAVALVFALVPPAAPVAASSLLDQIKEVQRQLDELKQNIEKTRARYNETKQKEQSVQKRLDELDQEITATEAKLAQIEGQIDQTNALLAKTTAELEAAEDELAWREGLVADRLVVLYKAGHLSYLEVLLSAKSFSDFVERFQLLRLIAQNDAQLMYETQAARDRVAAKKAEVTAQKERLEALQSQYRGTKSDLDAKYATAEQLKQKLEQDKEALAAALDEMEASSRRVEQILNNLKVEYARQSGQFALVYPLGGGRRYRISDTFGMRFHPILRAYRMHTGVDLAAPQGTPVLAASDGVVVYAGWMSGYGNTTVIDHGVVNGHRMATLYGHQSRISVEVGQVVQAGQTIGAVGSTGLATGPHLHFEVRVDGKPVDPQKYIDLR
ncbi:MAG: peptidoglycan DD-metalloendopeptidase family protein [Clostridia bacterium]|nr:peptidoglycan DD-metalloendopeptidase family protein [Clostridia bacterium]